MVRFKGSAKFRSVDVSRRAAAIAGPTISGRKSPTWRTIERLAQAVGCHLDVRVLPRLTREDRRAFAAREEADVRASMFHDSFGYYAQGVVESTARLPGGWQARLVPFDTLGTRGVTA